MITAIVLTKNEEVNIVDCVEGVLFCDQIVVVDDNSTDRTLEVLKFLRNKNRRIEIYEHSLDLNFSNQRNYALSKAKNEWVLFVDADERISEALSKEILEKIRQRNLNGLYIKREDKLWGKILKHGEAANIWLLRVARKKAGKWRGSVHEVWEIEGRKEKLFSPMLHFPHQEVTSFLKEINFYTDIRAQELHKKGIKANAFSIILYPKAKFLLNFILKRGYLDGIPGLIYAVFMSFHSFLVRGKLWQLSQR